MKCYSLMIIAVAMSCLWGPPAGAFESIGVYADSTLYDVYGYLVDVQYPGQPANTYFLAGDLAGEARVLAIRLAGQPYWIPMDPETYLTPRISHRVGDSFKFLPDSALGPQTATVDAIFEYEWMGVQRLTMRYSVRADYSPSVVRAVFAVADGVGIIHLYDPINLTDSRLRDYQGSGGVETGDFLPLNAGNRWEYDFLFVAPVEEASNTRRLNTSCYPNPFNPQTAIAFELPKQGVVSLRIFDVAGRLVRVLIDGEVYGQGRHEAIWRSRDDSGRHMSSGIYFYRLEAGGRTLAKRMTLLK